MRKVFFFSVQALGFSRVLIDFWNGRQGNMDKKGVSLRGLMSR